MGGLSLDGTFWRQFARLGARGPWWFARYAPPLIGVTVAAFAPGPRRSIALNLRRIRGPRSIVREAADLAATFATYASCLTEALGAGSDAVPPPEARVVGQMHVDAALQDRRG